MAIDISNIQRVDCTKIHIIVAEKSDLVRYGLRSLFAHHTEMGLIADTNCLQELLELGGQHNPDIILADLQLKDGSIAEYIQRLLKAFPRSKILVSTPKNNNDQYLLAYQFGVAGIICKACPSNVLLDIIFRICERGVIGLDCHNLALSRNSIQPPAESSASLVQANVSQSVCAKLSNSERRIARLACRGVSAKEISRQFSVTERTVRNQLSVIYKKTGVKKQIELCLKASSYNYFQ